MRKKENPKEENAVREKKIKGNQKIALERIYRLFELAEGNKLAPEPSKSVAFAGDAKPNGFATYSKRYLQLAKRIGEKCRVSIPKELKTKYCKKCYSMNIETRKEKPFLIVKCKECKYEKKFGLEKKEATEELVDIVDEEDRVIKSIPRKLVEQKDLLHRAVFVFVINSKNEVLLTKRSEKKLTYPGLWGIGAGGGVQAGEDYETAAKRELLEEIGIREKIDFLFDFNFKSKTDRFKGKVYLTKWDGKVTPAEDEIEESKFATKEEIEKLIKQKLLCPDTALMFEKYLKTRDEKIKEI
jgi:isopentenyl-diphosphate delta-isomerase type 1